LNSIQDIIEKIELYALNDQYETTTVNVIEQLEGNKINFTFSIEDVDRYYVKNINIFGNSVTNENVIRNEIIIDEGDPFNEILFSKSINNLKQLNFFRDIRSDTITNENDKTKTINITVEEKPTGEIALGAGFGTGGGTLAFSVKENNFLGNGVNLNTSLSLSQNSIKGQFGYFNPNYKNSDKSIYYNLQATEIDRLTNFGYKSNKVGFSLGTNFEYLDSLNLGLGLDNFLEKITTDSNASIRQKSQSGNYWDTFINLDLNYDKRNQKYQTTSGFLSLYNIKFPIISKGLTLSNEYIYKHFTELYENNLTSTSFLFSFANSLNNKEIKLSERLFIPSRNLRGFEAGKIGPKDGNDFIGGNFISSLNFSSTLPKILENSQNLDFLLFFDAANIWGVDYDSNINDNSGLRSSIGLGIDWLTPVGPLSFSFAQPITKKDSDITETFRFNIGTSF
jgi:outer membrane protein insertion porin family